jgi:hypothetical protein
MPVRASSHSPHTPVRCRWYRVGCPACSGVTALGRRYRTACRGYAGTRRWKSGPGSGQRARVARGRCAGQPRTPSSLTSAHGSERATLQAVACSEPRRSLVNFTEGVDSVVRGGRPVSRGHHRCQAIGSPPGVAGMACRDSSSGHHGRAWPATLRTSAAAYKGRPRRHRGLARQSERPIVPPAGAGQQNRRRGKGPYSHHASNGTSPGGLP